MLSKKQGKNVFSCNSNDDGIYNLVKQSSSVPFYWPNYEEHVQNALSCVWIPEQGWSYLLCTEYISWAATTVGSYSGFHLPRFHKGNHPDFHQRKHLSSIRFILSQKPLTPPLAPKQGRHQINKSRQLIPPGLSDNFKAET